MGDKSEYFLDVSDTDNGIAFKFETFEDFAQWVEEELSSLEWIQKQIETHQSAFPNPRNFIAPLNHLKNLTRDYQNNTDINHRTSLQQQIERELNKHYFKNHMLQSNSSSGIYVLKLKDELGELAAATCAQLLSRKPVNPASGELDILRGITRAMQFLDGFPIRQQSEWEEIENLKNRISTAANSSEQVVKLSNQKLEEWSQQVSDKIQTKEDNVESEIKKFRQNIAQQIEACKQEIAQTVMTYTKQMALNAPVEYWRKKRFWHWITFGMSTAILIALVGLGGWGLLTLWENILGETLSNTPTWKFGVAALSATIYLLAIRIVSRIMLSNLHLANEADERVVMTQTYLSLSSDGHMDNNEFLIHVLQALFRPSVSGLIKEDAVSQSALDAVSRITTNTHRT